MEQIVHTGLGVNIAILCASYSDSFLFSREVMSEDIVCRYDTMYQIYIFNQKTAIQGVSTEHIPLPETSEIEQALVDTRMCFQRRNDEWVNMPVKEVW